MGIDRDIADERSVYAHGLEFGDDSFDLLAFAEYLRQALPNATFVGFTGTPIDDKDRSTVGVYGEVIDTYDMTQAVADKATVPIHYTARLAKLRLNLTDEDRMRGRLYSERRERETSMAGD